MYFYDKKEQEKEVIKEEQERKQRNKRVEPAGDKKWHKVYKYPRAHNIHQDGIKDHGECHICGYGELRADQMLKCPACGKLACSNDQMSMTMCEGCYDGKYKHTHKMSRGQFGRKICRKCWLTLYNKCFICGKTTVPKAFWGNSQKENERFYNLQVKRVREAQTKKKAS